MKKKNQENNQVEAEVLYQRLGNRWFAFSVIGDDVFFGALDTDDILESPAPSAELQLPEVPHE